MSAPTGPNPTTQQLPPGLVWRGASERFHSRNDWLDSRHTFSFAGHHDPAWMGFGPLRVINDDTIAAGQGFGMHPHRDMEIVTVMVEGMLEHRDSLGNGEALRAGEVQRMTAGTGITHSEWNTGQEPCRLLQIWIEPQQRGLPPSYGQRRFQIGSGWTPLIAPDGAAGTLAIARPVRLWRAQPRQGEVLPVTLREGSLGWLQLIGGAVNAVGALAAQPGHGLGAGDGLGFSAGALQRLEASQDSDLLLLELT